MQKVSVKKEFFFDLVKAALLSVIVGAILILIFAVVLNFVPIKDSVVTAVNQAIKLISILLGCMLGIKEKRSGLMKGLLVGIVYAIAMVAIFSILNKSFSFGWGTVLDVGLGAVMGAVSGILSVNIGKNR